MFECLDSFYVDMAGKKYRELEDQLTSIKEDLKALKSRRDDLQEDNAQSSKSSQFNIT